MNKRENESYLSYAKRITKAKEDGLISYEEFGDYLLGDENVYSADNTRKFYYQFKKVLNKVDNDTVSDSDIIKELEQAKDELFKERVRLQDKKREISKSLREEARFERLIEVLKENVSPIKQFNWEYVKWDKTDEATLLLSDLHIGLEVENEVNKFNKEIAIDRLKKVVDKTIKKLVINEVSKLNIVLCGDLISGIINVTHRVEQEEDVISQIITCSEILAQVIAKLDIHFDIKVFGVIGNHSRIIADKKSNLNRENFERMIFEYLKIKCPNVCIETGENKDYLVYEVNNKKIIITHGDKDAISNAKQHFTNLLGFIPDMILMGHIHHFNVKNDNDTVTITNGSLISTDDYAVSLRRATKPSQTLIIHGEDNIIIELKLEE